MKLTNEQLDRAAQSYLKAHGSTGEPTDFLLAELRKHHEFAEAIEEALGTPVASVKDLASLKAAVKAMMDDLFEGWIVKEEPENHPDEARLNFLAQFWDSQAEGTQPIKVLLKNVSGSLRDAIDAAKNGVVGFHHMKPSVPDPDVTPIRVEPGTNEPHPARQSAAAHRNALIEHLSYAWTIIANAGGGDWNQESVDWREAAARWRDEYHTLIGPCIPPAPLSRPNKLQAIHDQRLTEGPKFTPGSGGCTICGQLWIDHIKPTMKCPT